MEVLSFAIVGAVVSTVVQLIKSSTSNQVQSELVVIALSLIAGVVFFFIKDSSLLTDFLAILGAANSVYLFLIKPWQPSPNL